MVYVPVVEDPFLHLQSGLWSFWHNVFKKVWSACNCV